MRRIARGDTTVANTKRYITTAGVVSSFDAELTEVSDDTPTLAEKTITVHKAQAFVQSSIEVAADQPDFASVEVPRLIADAKANLEGPIWMTGTGSDQPFGLWTRVNGSASELTNAGAEGVFAAVDVYSSIEDLSVRHRPNARFMAELSTINQIDQFETGNGAKLFPRVGDANPVLLQRALVENSSVDAHSDINVAATEDNALLWVGDFSQFVILDRVGMVVEFLPALFSVTTNLPDGRRGWYAHWRVGSDLLVTDAVRAMNVPTTA